MPSTVIRYVIVALLSLTGAWLLALGGHWVQHHLLPPAYLVLPINLISLYFFVLFALTSVWLAERTNRLHSSLIVAAVLTILHAGARVLYWASVAVRLSPYITSPHIEADVETGPAFWSVSVLGVCAFGALVRAIVKDLRREPVPKSEAASRK